MKTWFMSPQEWYFLEWLYFLERSFPVSAHASGRLFAVENLNLSEETEKWRKSFTSIQQMVFKIKMWKNWLPLYMWIRLWNKEFLSQSAVSLNSWLRWRTSFLNIICKLKAALKLLWTLSTKSKSFTCNKPIRVPWFNKMKGNSLNIDISLFYCEEPLNCEKFNWSSWNLKILFICRWLSNWTVTKQTFFFKSCYPKK